MLLLLLLTCWCKTLLVLTTASKSPKHGWRLLVLLKYPSQGRISTVWYKWLTDDHSHYLGSGQLKLICVIKERELISIMANIVSTFRILLHLAVSLLSTCHSLTSTPFGFSWKTSKLERLQYVQPEESHYRREREWERQTERAREHVNGDRGMIFGQLYNWLLIQCSLHIRASPPPLTLWLIRCSQNVLTQATKIYPSHNENVSWQLTLLFFPSLSLPFCLSLLRAFFHITSWQASVSMSIMSVSDIQW